MEDPMVKHVFMLGAAAALLLAGCSINTEKCLAKEGFKNCEDFKAAAQKAKGNDEVYRFHTIAKKCNCKD